VNITLRTVDDLVSALCIPSSTLCPRQATLLTLCVSPTGLLVIDVVWGVRLYCNIFPRRWGTIEEKKWRRSTYQDPTTTISGLRKMHRGHIPTVNDLYAFFEATWSDSSPSSATIDMIDKSVFDCSITCLPRQPPSTAAPILNPAISLASLPNRRPNSRPQL